MPVCVAPQFSSVIYGIATFWYTVTMIVSPIYVGFIVDHHVSQVTRILNNGYTLLSLVSLPYADYSSVEHLLRINGHCNDHRRPDILDIRF